MKVLLHTTDVVNSRVIEILQKAKELSGVKETFEFAPLEDTYVPPRGVPVLSLGAYKRRGQERVVQTYSVKQIMVKGDAISRLITAFKLLESVPELPELRYEVVDNHTRLQEVSADLSGKLLAVDIETKGMVDAQVPEWEHIISIGLYDGSCAYVVSEELCQDLIAANRTINPLLQESELILHNGKFDGKYLGFYPDIDTMLMHYAVHPAASDHGLKPLAKEYFGAEDWDNGNKQYTKKATYSEYTDLGDGAYAEAMTYPGGSGYERIPRTKLYHYAAWDVYWTYWLYQQLKIELEEFEVNPYEHLMQLSHMFQRIETPGVRFDVDYMTQMQKELTQKGAELEKELHSEVGFELNPRSPKQLKEYFAGQGYQLASTDANTLAELSKAGNKVADLITQLRDVSKKNGTYITGYLDKLVDGRGYPTFKLHASITGRIGGGGTSLLTIPRDKSIKKMVLPDEGHVMVGADASQMELRIMALESQDPWLIEAFQPEAGDFFDLVIRQAYPDLDPVKFKEENIQDYTNLRAKIKGTIYGKSFNRGDKAIAQALGITLDEATKLSNAFIRPGSEFDQWRQEIMRKAVAGEPIVNKFGRRFQHELITSRNQQNVINSAMSFISQSTGNDLLLAATLKVEPELERFGARAISTIHDALYCSVPPENAEALGEFIVEKIVRSGEELYGKQVAFVSDWGIGQNLSEV